VLSVKADALDANTASAMANTLADTYLDFQRKIVSDLLRYSSFRLCHSLGLDIYVTCSFWSSAN